MIAVNFLSGHHVGPYSGLILWNVKLRSLLPKSVSDSETQLRNSKCTHIRWMTTLPFIAVKTSESAKEIVFPQHFSKIIRQFKWKHTPILIDNKLCLLWENKV
jgi:hypothetical protein